ncbi:MAG: outer membrane protein [Pseudomonadota bacterium]
MMKRLSALVAISLLSTSAFAADGDWSGWYVGGGFGKTDGNSDTNVALGGAWSTETQALRDHVVAQMSNDIDPDGYAYDLHFGYDHQFDGGFVLGGEFDYSKLNLDASEQIGPVPTVPFPSLSYTTRNDIEADHSLSLRAKAGFATGRHLFYATAGLARVDVNASASITSNGNYRKLGQRSETLDGTQYGLGYEFSLNDNWSARFEYLRTNLDEMNYDTVYLPGSAFVTPAYTERVNQDLDYDTIRLGVNYRF